MNEGEYPERPSGFLLGKEFIIVLVIVFSGLSFTLGYFVGRNTVGHEAVSPLQAAVGAMQQNRQEPLPAPPDQPGETAQASSPPQTVQGVASEPMFVVAMQDKHGHKETVAVSHGQQKAAAQPKDDEQTASHAGTEETFDTAVPMTTADEKTKRYTVQIGAFKNTEDANYLKTAFEKKGYKPFISQVKDPKGGKIYKVKTGEFRDKKDAEVLALKLKKTEGLHTYVTTRSE
jgi:cell division septation protein DedD